MAVQLPKNEARRIEALRRYGILDTPPDQVLDGITALAAHICDVPIALITFVDSQRQWFKSKVGLSIAETAREISFCAHAMLNPDQVMVVPNALADERFAHNPWVTGGPQMRSYTGVPLVTPDGFALGALCVIDRVPRELNSEQLAASRTLRRSVVAELELCRMAAQLQHTTSALADLDAHPDKRVLVRSPQVLEALTQFETQKSAESLLRASELRFRTLWETTSDAIVLLDEESRIQYANPALRDVFRHEPGDVIGASIEILQPPALRDAHKAGYMRHLRTGVKTLNWRSVDTSGLHRSGREFPVEVAFSRMDFEGKPVFAGFIRDISERKHLQTTAAAHIERFQMVARATNDALWDWDLVTNLVWWSEGYQTLFGYRAEEIKPGLESWHDPIHPGDRERVVHGIHALIDAGGQSWADEYRFRRRDGTYAHVYDRGYVSHDKDGKAMRMIGAIQDITGRVQAESVLRESEARFRIFAEQSPDAMTMHQEGKIVFVNDAMVSLMRQPRSVTPRANRGTSSNSSATSPSASKRKWRQSGWQPLSNPRTTPLSAKT